MAKRSAGILVCRPAGGSVEVLLVHPGGPFFARRDGGAWSIPKGEIEEGEDELEAAVREFGEELGTTPAGPFHPLAPVRQAGGKTVLAWWCEGDVDTSGVASNTFTMEWPPRSGRRQSFPEIDRAAYFPLDEALTKINAAQRAFLDELREQRRLRPRQR